jgi:3-dehydroquinate synthase
VVIEDPHERGIRKSLNFGHTVGHAVETNSLLNDKQPLTHGEAIAIGIVCEAWLSHKKCGLSEAELDEITAVIKNHYPKYKVDTSCHDVLHELMLKDKKNYGAQINCTLITKIGECHIDNVCSKDELCASLEYYASL